MKPATAAQLASPNCSAPMIGKDIETDLAAGALTQTEGTGTRASLSKID